MNHHLNRRRALALSGAASLGLGPVSPAASQTAGTNMTASTGPLADRAAVIDLVNRVALMADRRDWSAVRACFDDRVHIDYTSLTGGAAAEQDADALVVAWAGLLPGFDATQHVIANHQVTLLGDEAECLSQFRAQHRIGSGVGVRVWELDGGYEHGLVRRPGGWRIRRLVMRWTFERGDRALAAEVANRAKRTSPTLARTLP